MNQNVDINLRPNFDEILTQIADYILDYNVVSVDAYQTAHLCLMDTLGCGILALRYPECTKLLGPVVAGTVVPNGTHVPGTNFILDPVRGAFNIGTMIRWLDFNDTWLAAEWGHPSDNLGGILAVGDYLSRQRLATGGSPLLMRDILTAMIKAHEIQGILALENSFNRIGLDHVILVKVASVAIITQMLGGNREEILNALSLAFLDGQSLRTYRHAPNTGSRKSWAAGDATSRAVELALMAVKGEMGYPSVLTAKIWGFYDVLFKGQTFKLSRPLTTCVMENILFKISYPAEFHAQTAVECAILLHPRIKEKLNDIEKIVLTTHESAIRIISKEGPLYNPADRDHCLQYMVATGLIFGELTADYYENKIAADVRIDWLRSRMQVQENKQFSVDYLDFDKRSITNAIQIFFKDGSSTEEICIEYPLGHKRRRQEGIPLLMKKFRDNLLTHYTEKRAEKILRICQVQKYLEKMPVNQFADLF